MEDVADYRRRYEAELAAAAPPPDALAAPLEVDALPQRVPELLATLRDAGATLDARLAAQRALGALDFLGPRFAPFRADYKQALRDVATDPEPELRERALEVLAIDKDPYAQDLLVRGLERPQDALVSDARAIQFLGYDDHAELAPLVRRVFRRTRGAAREEALRLLATDPQSERLFTRLLKDRSETRSIRRISASGLQSLNPEAFERAARTIVADDAEDDDTLATVLAALAHGREAHAKPADPKLVEAVRKLGERTRSRTMRASIRRFLASAEP